MGYHPAFHLADGVFVRCRDCAAVVYTEDTATHDAFHEEIDRRIKQLQQMYGFLADRVIPPEVRERLTEPQAR